MPCVRARLSFTTSCGGSKLVLFVSKNVGQIGFAMSFLVWNCFRTCVKIGKNFSQLLFIVGLCNSSTKIRFNFGWFHRRRRPWAVCGPNLFLIWLWRLCRDRVLLLMWKGFQLHCWNACEKKGRSEKRAKLLQRQQMLWTILNWLPG